MFSLVSNHLKLRVVVFLLPENEPFTRTEGADPLPQDLPCRSAVFLQKLRINNPNTGSRDLMTLTLRESEMTGVFSWLQFALSPLDVTGPLIKIPHKCPPQFLQSVLIRLSPVKAAYYEPCLHLFQIIIIIFFVTQFHT